MYIINLKFAIVSLVHPSFRKKSSKIPETPAISEQKIVFYIFLETTCDHLIGSYPHYVLACVVYISKKSKWNDFFWKIDIPKETLFQGKTVHEVRKAFTKLGKKEALEIWNVRLFIIIIFFLCNQK